MINAINVSYTSIDQYHIKQSNTNKTMNIMIIGDSVDRNTVEDWCEINSGLLYMLDVNKYRTISMNSSIDKSYLSYLERLKSMYHSKVEISICIHKEMNIVISFIFNKFGVIPQLWCERQQHHNINEIDEYYYKNRTIFDQYSSKLLENNKYYDTKIFFSAILLPAITMMLDIHQHHVDNVVIQSSFWDIAKYFECYELIKSNRYVFDPFTREEFIKR